MTGIQDTSSETFRKLLGNGLTYEIPKFQRDYSWDIEQWDDLWQDIKALELEEEVVHYMGYLVLQTADNKVYRVIDGQQRLITLSILILAVLDTLKGLIERGIDPEKNAIRSSTLRNSYIGYLDPVSLVPRNKIKLNRNNDDFYRQKLVPIGTLPGRGLNASEKLLKKCFLWFGDKTKADYQTGESLARLVDLIVDKMFFTVITVSDEINAFKVFETLNARGVQLSSADLLKNYLFSVVDSTGAHSSEIQEMESLWSRVIGKLGSEKFPGFLKTFWNSRYGSVRKSNLFKEIRKSIHSKEGAFSLLRALDDDSDIYIALRNPDDELWNGKKEISDYSP